MSLFSSSKQSAQAQHLSYAYLLGKAWPIILANASVPLLGLADTAVIGNVGSIEDLGAIAFGALIFSFVYWSFGFLRMGTTGFVAQAAGANDSIEVRAALGRALLIAMVLGLALIIVQWPLEFAVFSMLAGSEQVEALSANYFAIRIWGAPATLSTFVLMGVLIGLGESRKLLLLQLFLNGLNITLDIVFAGVLAMGVQGIALGTVIAEWSAVIFASWIIFQSLRAHQTGGEFWPILRIFNRQRLLQTLSANSDIMIRTLLLLFSFAWFTNQSARFGDVVLAANHILLQMISFSAFFLDGYAYVVESLVGNAVGSRDRLAFDIAVIRSSILAAITAAGLALLVWFSGNAIIELLTDLDAVRDTANSLLLLAAVYVFLAFAAFQLDGIFIGASCTRSMRNASFISIAVFLAAYFLLIDRFGIQGLWWAFIIYVCARAGALLLFYRQLRESVAAG